MGPNPQSPIPNPQSPIPIEKNYEKNIIFLIKLNYKLKKIFIILIYIKF